MYFTILPIYHSRGLLLIKCLISSSAEIPVVHVENETSVEETATLDGTIETTTTADLFAPTGKTRNLFTLVCYTNALQFGTLQTFLMRILIIWFLLCLF